MSAQPPAPVRGIELPPALGLLRKPFPAPALHIARAGARRYGMATARHRALPDFLIIGAKKAGTSSLVNWLFQHPAVLRMFPSVQRLKSPHYFDVNYWRGARWYQSHFPTRKSRARRLRVQEAAVTGEASPYYLFHPAAAQRAAVTVPTARVIVVLRDPVSRAYSNYWDRRAAGCEDLPTFDDAIAAEPARMQTVDQHRLVHDPHYYSFSHDNHSYLARGRYAEQLPAWLQAFPLPQMLVLRAESLFAEPERVFGEVQQFLGIPVEGVQLRRYNERPREPMPADTRARLADYYRPHNAALYALLGQDLEWERRYPS